MSGRGTPDQYVTGFIWIAIDRFMIYMNSEVEKEALSYNKTSPSLYVVVVQQQQQTGYISL